MTLGKCLRCGGQMLHNYDDYSCLQCGYSPPPPVVSMREVEEETHKISTSRRNFSDKPSQVRRRRRRLVQSGHTPEEAEDIIRLQLSLG